MNEWSQFDSCYVKYPEANHQDLGPGDPGCWENRHGFTDFIAQDLDVYPLVNIQKTMENHHAINGKIHYKYPF